MTDVAKLYPVTVKGREIHLIAPTQTQTALLHRFGKQAESVGNLLEPLEVEGQPPSPEVLALRDEGFSAIGSIMDLLESLIIETDRPWVLRQMMSGQLEAIELVDAFNTMAPDAPKTGPAKKARRAAA
jgi:hypothetical protein